MEFIIGFPTTSKKNDFIMFVVDRSSKVAHFIAVNSTNSAREVAHIFIREIMRLHGVPKNIISDIDAQITSTFYKDFFSGLGIDLAFNTTYHL